MLIGFIGARGTVPTAENATVSFLVDNKFLFECPSEIVQSFQRFQKNWQMIDFSNSKIIALGKPSFGKIKYIILSHLHFDHWGGLPHIIHRILLFEREKRIKDPIKVIIPEGSTIQFQRRASQIFKDLCSDFILEDNEFLYRLLSIEVGEDVRRVVDISVIKDEEELILDSEYSIKAKRNIHLDDGSFAYNLEFKVTKLNVDKVKTLNIPFDHTLKDIEKSKGEIIINNLEIKRSDIFYEKSIQLSYSGDTPIDPDLIGFFRAADVLIHEITYLTTEEKFHLDSHSDIDPLINLLENHKNLKVLIPIHFSIRYTDQEIQDILTSKQANYEIFNPLEKIALFFDFEDSISYSRLEFD